MAASDILFCHPSNFGAAVTRIIQRRTDGLAADVLPTIADPKRVLLEALYRQLSDNVSPDTFAAHMQAFANGGIAINGHPQSAAEAGVYAGTAAHAFRDLCATADRTLFRSYYELELAACHLQYRPTRTAIYCPVDSAVPEPVSAQEPIADTMVVWAVGVPDVLLECATRILHDVRLAPFIVRKPTDITGGELASARLIVSLSDDPGTAIALARFGRPLAVATHAAAEVLENVQTFDIWNPTRVVDSAIVAMGGPPPVLRKEAVERANPPKTDPEPAFGDDAPLVTVVMTVYDRLGHLDENLARLQRQTYPNVEIVVVSNNGPRADGVCAKYPNVHYIHRDQNSGAAGAPRNDGIAAARGTYITCLDDDDVFFPDHCARMVAICERGIKAVYSDFLIQIVEKTPDGGEVVLGYDLEKGDGITPYELFVMNRIGYMTVFAHREVYERLGAYDLTDRVYGANEVELWLRISSAYPMVHSDRPTTVYTIRKNWQGSLTATDHFLFADGYEKLYRYYTAEGMPLVQQRRLQHLQSLRATAAAPARAPRYPAEV